MRHLRYNICGTISLIEMIIVTGGSLDAKDRLGCRTIEIATVHIRIENWQMLTEGTEDPLSEEAWAKS
jgi:hypothetical protein